MKICDETLTTDNVSIQSDEYGTKNYKNSGCQLGQGGRKDLEVEVPTELVAEVYKVWGDTATVVEPTYPTVLEDTGPTIDARISALEAATLSLVTGG